ncbi:MAG TPA: M23 family metallopeptidase [Gaiellaceae bacterium]|nr:M23 family metallopeptidase [Gaiellaceae bacterium]
MSRVSLAVLAAAVMLAAPASATQGPAMSSYPWPLRPFKRPHAIRGYFNDPRQDFVGDEPSSSFHFGIDIAAFDGAGVYAVEAGRASRHADYVTVTSAGGRDFGYWHIDPAVAQDQHVEAGDLLGRVQRGWGHVHFAENVNGVYLNPLRPGALSPYTDTTSPTVAAVAITRAGKPVDPAHVTGVVSLTCDAYDIPPLAPPPPWRDTRVTPVLIRWRIYRARGRPVMRWRTAIDFRFSLKPNALFTLVYAPGTAQNRADRPGRYVFYLKEGWSSAKLPNGDYRLKVGAWDSRGNSAFGSLPFTIDNPKR